MTFKEWYEEFSRSIGWYGMSAQYAIDQTAEEAWNMGFTEGVNSCRNTEPKKYTVVTAKELKPDDIIIHNYQAFEITKHGSCKGTGTLDFGETWWFTGEYILLNKRFLLYPDDSSRARNIADAFYISQECPMIKVIT